MRTATPVNFTLDLNGRSGPRSSQVAHALIDVVDVDNARTVPVARPGEGARHRRVLHQGRYVEDLPRLEVGADANHELGVAFDAGGRIHARSVTAETRPLDLRSD